METRERWARLVRRWRHSGQTANEFARSAGINAATLTHWAWRLKREGGSWRPAAVKLGKPEPVGGAGFVELIARRVEEQRFELELVDGRRIRIPAGFDAPSLGRLLAVLNGSGR